MRNKVEARRWLKPNILRLDSRSGRLCRVPHPNWLWRTLRLRQVNDGGCWSRTERPHMGVGRARKRAMAHPDKSLDECCVPTDVFSWCAPRCANESLCQSQGQLCCQPCVFPRTQCSLRRRGGPWQNQDTMTMTKVLCPSAGRMSQSFLHAVCATALFLHGCATFDTNSVVHLWQLCLLSILAVEKSEKYYVYGRALQNQSPCGGWKLQTHKCTFEARWALAITFNLAESVAWRLKTSAWIASF